MAPGAGRAGGTCASCAWKRGCFATRPSRICVQRAQGQAPRSACGSETDELQKKHTLFYHFRRVRSNTRTVYVGQGGYEVSARLKPYIYGCSRISAVYRRRSSFSSAAHCSCAYTAKWVSRVYRRQCREHPWPVSENTPLRAGRAGLATGLACRRKRKARRGGGYA